MSELRPCPDCHRHVKNDETSCPFCSAELAPTAPRQLPRGRLTRAAVFASALAGSAAACGTSQPTAEGPNDKQPPPAVADAGTGESGDEVGPPSPPDASVQPEDVREERPPPDHDIPMPYGAPPARSRVV